MLQSSETHTAAHDALKNALNFTAQDLQANRSGNLSAAQRRQFAQRTLSFSALTVASVVVLIVAYNALPETSSQAIAWEAVLIFPLALAVAAFAAFETLSAFLKLQRDQVSVLRGDAEIEYPQGNRRLFATLKIGKTALTLPKAQLTAFETGKPYAIYYTTAPKQILSAEPIDKRL